MTHYIFLAVMLAVTGWILYRLSRLLKGKTITNGNDNIPVEAETVGQTAGLSPEKTIFPAATKAVTKSKRPEEPEGYEETFLVDHISKIRISVNINRDLFYRIRTYLPVIAPELAMSSYLNNIITEHIETHLDEINKLYNSNFKKQL